MFWKGSRREVLAEPISDPADAASQPCALLSRFFHRIVQVQPSPHILMLGELCGANVSFLGKHGFRVCVEADVVPGPAGTYAGALVWDALSLMPPIEARRRTLLLHDVLASGGAVLAFFRSAASAASCPRTRYRILSENLLSPESVQGRAGVVHPYQNREIIRLFDPLDLDLLHTHRDGQREVMFIKRRPGSRDV